MGLGGMQLSPPQFQLAPQRAALWAGEDGEGVIVQQQFPRNLKTNQRKHSHLLPLDRAGSSQSYAPPPCRPLREQVWNWVPTGEGGRAACSRNQAIPVPMKH